MEPKEKSKPDKKLAHKLFRKRGKILHFSSRTSLSKSVREVKKKSKIKNQTFIHSKSTWILDMITIKKMMEGTIGFSFKNGGMKFLDFVIFFVCLSNSSVSQKVLTTLFFQHLKGTFWRRGTFFLIGHRIILGLSELFNSMCHNRGMISNVRRSGSGKLFAKKEKKRDRMLLKDEKSVLKSESKESRN